MPKMKSVKFQEYAIGDVFKCCMCSLSHFLSTREELMKHIRKFHAKSDAKVGRRDEFESGYETGFSQSRSIVSDSQDSKSEDEYSDKYDGKSEDELLQEAPKAVFVEKPKQCYSCFININNVLENSHVQNEWQTFFAIKNNFKLMIRKHEEKKNKFFIKLKCKEKQQANFCAQICFQLGDITLTCLPLSDRRRQSKLILPIRFSRSENIKFTVRI
eukprot:TRINITY_DN25563_c0_g1_i1.p1 TRINITY_DN25563_c0_g1~~TRINITY_DN25563_c0_g1_i1.p1  ORF type:complete len:215 (-),score=39.18 TRINITY_DN25563_c0_g1_i1:277-921(-)